MNPKKHIVIFTFLLSLILRAQNEFITIWKPSNPPTQTYTQNNTPRPLSTNNQAYFPGIGNNYRIDWEEVGNAAHSGTLSNVSSSLYQPILIDFGNPIATNPSYKLKVSNGNGNFNSVRFSSFDADVKKIIDIQQWGNIQWQDMPNAFGDCSNLNISATDIPNFSETTTTRYMFSGCTNLTGNSSFNLWDTSNITDMYSMFSGASNFNQDIGNWNTSNVTDFSWMFYRATNFNQNIGSWDTSNAKSMQSMFWEATNFNQNIGNWNTSNVITMASMFQNATNFNQNIGQWNMSNVKDISQMFAFYTTFNQDISNWDTSNVVNMHGMFYHANNFSQNIGNWNTANVTDIGSIFAYSDSFNQDISKWNLKNLTNAVYMFFDAKITCDNYNKILVGWANNPNTPNNIDISPVSFLKYSSTDAVTARNKLINKGWVISGDTYDPSCLLSTNEISETSKIKIYPNPTSEFFYVKNAKENDIISFYDTSGKLIRTEKLDSEKKVSVNDLQKGNYVIVIDGNSSKVIIK